MKKEDDIKEVWKNVVFDKTISPKVKYKVSNLGNLKRLKVGKRVWELVLLKPTDGYRMLYLQKKKVKKSKEDQKKDQKKISSKGKILHRLIAETFLEKESSLHQYVIHLNYIKTDNRIVNLKWVTKEEVYIHKLKNRKNRKSKTKEEAIERLKRHDHLNLDPIYGEEKWKFIEFDEKISKEEKFQVSNYGRIISYKTDKINGLIKRPVTIGNYHSLSIKQITGKNTGRYIHKLVAQAFLPFPKEEEAVVIHLDYNKTNNHVSNLKWATQSEAKKHQIKNPDFKTPSSKLTENQVRLIKKKLADPKRKTRVKMLAKQFGVSEMQLWRIKSGENWGHVKI